MKHLFLVCFLSVVGCTSSHCPGNLDEVNGMCQCPEGFEPNSELRRCIAPDGSFIPWPDGVDVYVPDAGASDAGSHDPGMDADFQMEDAIDAPLLDAGDDAMDPIDAGSDAGDMRDTGPACTEPRDFVGEQLCDSVDECPSICGTEWESDCGGADYARGVAFYTVDLSGTIDVGHRLRTGDGREYQVESTDGTGMLGTVVDLHIASILRGPAQNLSFGTTLEVVVPPGSGLPTARVRTVTGGRDDECELVAR